MTRAYDGFGRMDSETQDGSLTLTYLHDESGAVKEITYPTGSVIVGMRYTLDDMSRPTTIERKLSTSVEGVSTSTWETTATMKYLGHREVERLQSPYDLKRTQSYTSFREPEDLEYKKNSTGALKTGLHSIWDADGRMTVRERMHDESGGYEWGEVFRYDEMGRLTKMWYDVRNPNSFASNDPVSGTNPYDHKVDWTLGKVYERDAVVKTTYGGAVIVNQSYTDNLHYQVTAGPATMAWNDNGHLTDRGSDDFAWTALGQLRQAAISGQTARDYTYDAFGRRVKTVAGSQTNRFLYDGWHMIGEYDSTAGHWLWQEGPWCEGERMLEHVARDTNDLDTDSNTTEYRTYAVHEDFQATVWGLSDTSAAVVERYSFTDPYGTSETRNAVGSPIGTFATEIFSSKRLHGGRSDSMTQLMDYRIRMLEITSGQWTARDPIPLADSENSYQCNLCNPITNQDPFGLYCEDRVIKCKSGFRALKPSCLQEILDTSNLSERNQYVPALKNRDILLLFRSSRCCGIKATASAVSTEIGCYPLNDISVSAIEELAKGCTSGLSKALGPVLAGVTISNLKAAANESYCDCFTNLYLMAYCKSNPADGAFVAEMMEKYRVASAELPIPPNSPDDSPRFGSGWSGTAVGSVSH